jgi:uncharacterized small protein (DUF1192 family)
MFDDDLDPKTKRPALKKLDNMSVDELELYIISMQEEIERVRAEVAKKKAYQQAADSFFKS